MKSSVSGTKARRPPSSTCTKTRRFPPRLVVPHCLDRDLVRDPRGSPSPEAVLFLEEALNLLGGHSAIPAVASPRTVRASCESITSDA